MEWVAQDLSFLEKLTRSLVESGRSAVTVDGEDYPCFLASGSNLYPAFWTRDSVWVAQSGMLDEDELLSMLTILALTQNDDTPVQLANGLVAPAWTVPDHVVRSNADPVWFPGVWEGGEDQGDGRFGMRAAQDACYMFIELAFLLAQAKGWEKVANLVLGGMPVAERLQKAFFSPEADAETELAFCTDETRAVAFSDAIIKTGYMLDGSILRWRASCRLAEMSTALGVMDDAERYAAIARSIRTHLPQCLWQENPDTGDGWLLSASGKGRQRCVRGTSFALALGILDAPYREKASRAMCAAALPAEYGATPTKGEITYLGQIRHLVDGEFWTDTPMREDSYQNGGYWGMFTGWVLAGMQIVSPDFAKATAEVYIEHLRRENFLDGTEPSPEGILGAPYEWVHPNGRRKGAKYLPSLTLFWRYLNGGFAVGEPSR